MPVAGALSGTLVWGLIWDTYGVFREGQKIKKYLDSIGLGGKFGKLK